MGYKSDIAKMQKKQKTGVNATKMHLCSDLSYNPRSLTGKHSEGIDPCACIRPTDMHIGCSIQTGGKANECIGIQLSLAINICVINIEQH